MDPVERMKEGNRRYLAGDEEKRRETSQNGQHPWAAVICCSDSRVIPEKIFDAGIGELFVIRVAGNVLDRHQMGSVEYALEHLGCKLVLMLGHTGCGAVAAALSGRAEGLVSYIVDDILAAIGSERDPEKACRLNVLHGVEQMKKEFTDRPGMRGVEFLGAVYDICGGKVTWL